TVSVVVPVYKVEKYLQACINSILAQTFRDLELILIDDGSPDNCGEICDKCAATDNRVRVFHEQNGGVTSARKKGVLQARGEWIFFVDSDDLVPRNALEILLSAKEKFGGDVDLVEGEVYRTKKDAQTGKLFVFERNKVRKTIIADGCGYAREVERETCTSGPYAKIIRRTLFSATNALDVPAKLTYGEDAIMCFRLSRKSAKPCESPHRSISI
ncbi:MAG: glycosyltransferase, partial [Opitutae bacterium]|nr:glycosyltransferase [Opitutae bacterium]